MGRDRVRDPSSLVVSLSSDMGGLATSRPLHAQMIEDLSCRVVLGWVVSFGFKGKERCERVLGSGLAGVVGDQRWVKTIPLDDLRSPKKSLPADRGVCTDQKSSRTRDSAESRLSVGQNR